MDSFNLKKRKPAERLKEAVERQKSLRDSPFTAASKQDRLPRYRDDPTIRAAAANDATTLREPKSEWHKQRNEPIRLAFAEFGLDPNDPWDWRYLLNDLCEIHFHEKPRRGRKGKWKGEEVLLLHRVVNSYKAERGKGVRDAIRTAKTLHPDWLGKKKDAPTLNTLERIFYKTRPSVKAAKNRR